MVSEAPDGFQSFLDTMENEDKLARKAAFLSILDYKPATVAEIARRSGLDLKTAETATRRLLEAGFMVADESGAVVGSWGLTLVPTSHRLVTKGKDYYTWCALDIVGIPAAFELDATIYSHCHQCGAPLTIETTKGELTSASKSDIHVWIAEREIGRPIIESF